MSYFIRNGNKFSVTDDASVDIHRSLPVGNYILTPDQFGNIHLELVDNFKPLSKVYGLSDRWRDRIINTFLSRENGTGVMLNGEKGSGKTLLARNLSLACHEQGISTLIINNAWHGDKFNKLIQDIDQPCMILFDEFEKVYDREQQESVLTLFDGVFPTKKLFVLTCNDKYRIDQHMRNRPGRIFYSIDFKGLDTHFITEYCEDNLNNKQHIKAICQLATLFGEFNFDMLKALVEEMNRYDESPQDAIKILNARPEFEERGEHEVTLVVNGEIVPPTDFWPAKWRGNPLKDEIAITHRVKRTEDDDHDFTQSLNFASADHAIEHVSDMDEEENRENYTFDAGMLSNIDADQKTFTFKNSRGVIVIMKKKVAQSYDYMKYMGDF